MPVLFIRRSSRRSLPLATREYSSPVAASLRNSEPRSAASSVAVISINPCSTSSSVPKRAMRRETSSNSSSSFRRLRSPPLPDARPAPPGSGNAPVWAPARVLLSGTATSLSSCRPPLRETAHAGGAPSPPARPFRRGAAFPGPPGPRPEPLAPPRCSGAQLGDFVLRRSARLAPALFGVVARLVERLAQGADRRLQLLGFGLAGALRLAHRVVAQRAFAFELAAQRRDRALQLRHIGADGRRPVGLRVRQG